MGTSQNKRIPKSCTGGISEEPIPKDLKLTPTGRHYGTPMYMSPEIATGDPSLDERSDVFALGVILFEILTLQSFVHGDDIIEIKQKILEKPYPLPRETAPNRKIPRELQAVCMKALQRKKNKRYPGVANFWRIYRSFVTAKRCPFIGIQDGKNLPVGTTVTHISS